MKMNKLKNIRTALNLKPKCVKQHRIVEDNLKYLMYKLLGNLDTSKLNQ